MRLAFLTVRMQLGNGVDLVIHELARRLSDRLGHEVDVWTPTSDGMYEGHSYNLRLIPLRGGAWNRVQPLHEYNAWRAMRRISRMLKREGARYDVVIPCAHPYYGAGRVLGAPSVFFNFGNVPTTGFNWKSKLNWRWLNYSENWLHKPYSTTVVSISRFLHEQQGIDIQHRGQVLYLGGDHYATGNSRDLRTEFRRQHGIAEDEVLLGYCGRMYHDQAAYKGLAEILRLGQLIQRRIAQARLVLCGAGTHFDGQWISETGALPLLNLPADQMPGFFAALDVYVCASRWEGFNLPIVEAAWHRVPSVAYDAGAHREHVTSVLVPDGDFDSLVEEAARLAGNARLRKKLGDESYGRAQQFNWDQITEQFDGILRGIAR